MVNQLRITVLVENTAGDLGILAEHGLALWIEADGRRLLVDTGQGMVLEHNAKALGVDLGTADSVVLSHGHYDHTGGIAEASGRFRNADLYVHPAAFAPKFVRRDDGTSQSVSAPTVNQEGIRSQVARMVLTAGPTQVAQGIWVTGEVPRSSGFEDTGGPFYLDQACTADDPLVDDQAMYIDSSEGIVVVLGCAHAGLVNTLNYVARLAGQKRIHAVLGGMHLLRASDERMEKTIDALDRYQVRLIAPGHCTGLKAVAAMMNRWPDRFVSLMVGRRIAIPSGALS